MSLRQRTSSRSRFDRSLKKTRPDASKGTEAGDRQRHRPLWRLYLELYRAIAGHRLEIAGALFALSIATMLKLVPPAATKLVIDQVLLHKPIPPRLVGWLPSSGGPKPLLVTIVATVLVVSALGTLFGLWGRWQATLATKRLQVGLRRRAFEHAVRLPLHRVHQLKSGGTASLLREDAGGVGELIFSLIYNPWRALVQLLGGLAVLATVDWRLLLGTLLVLPIVAWTETLWNRILRPLFRASRKQRQEIDARATETFGGMRVVRAFGRQRLEAARFVGDNHLLARQELHAWVWARTVEILWDLLLPVASGALLLYGGLRVLDGRLSLGELMMFLVYLTMLLEPLAVLATSASQVQGHLAGFDRVLDLLAEPRELIDRPGAISLSRGEVAGGMVLRDLGFRYPGSEAEVLHGIDLEIEPGQTVALVGRSGAGKTTLCNLVARFNDPTDGAIELDGVDLRAIRLESFRNLLGIVEQDVFLFDGTVAENIAYAAPRATRAQLERAARVANADEFIAKLPDGYETAIGERGVRLSGGQRQRLAIARAVLADPRILILDEATSNLDSESEQLIQRSLASLMRGRTCFVIAHRLSTIRRADRILVLEAGRIVESGTHADLMAEGGRYRDMVELQLMEAAG